MGPAGVMSTRPTPAFKLAPDRPATESKIAIRVFISLVLGVPYARVRTAASARSIWSIEL